MPDPNDSQKEFSRNRSDNTRILIFDELNGDFRIMRDLMPPNILINDNYFPLIIDFGIQRNIND